MLTICLTFIGTLYLVLGFFTAMYNSRWRYLFLWPVVLVRDVAFCLDEMFSGMKW